MQAVAANPTQPDELIAFAAQNDTPRWLAQAAESLLTRDPVKAANEAEALAALLGKRADRILADAQAAIPNS